MTHFLVLVPSSVFDKVLTLEVKLNIVESNIQDGSSEVSYSYLCVRITF